MADEPVFRDTARAAGEGVKRALQKGPDPAGKTSVHLSFNIESFDIESLDAESSDGQTNVLQKVKEDFETLIFEQRHSKGTVIWRNVFVIIKTLPDDNISATNETPVGNRQGDVWFLALAVGDDDEGKIGRSFSLRKRFKVVKGDVYVAYELK